MAIESMPITYAIQSNSMWEMLNYCNILVNFSLISIGSRFSFKYCLRPECLQYGH